MTQEEKQLLLKDLCARLPYGVKCSFISSKGDIPSTIVKIDVENETISHKPDGQSNVYFQWIESGYIKPYLRPMWSMTEEERKELKSTTCPEGTGYFDEQYLICPMSHFGEHISYGFMSDILDWLNSHHFDYHRLIDKGLALEAPEGMYKTEQEQMMKDAVEGEVFMSFAPGHNQMVMADVDLPTNTKVKLIIVNED